MSDEQIRKEFTQAVGSDSNEGLGAATPEACIEATLTWFRLRESTKNHKPLDYAESALKELAATRDHIRKALADLLDAMAHQGSPTWERSLQKACVLAGRYCDPYLSLPEPSKQTVQDAQNYYRVMGLLRHMKKEHGLCEPRERKACTVCNAKDELEVMLSEYKGQPIRSA